jgi:hypothetical protein
MLHQENPVWPFRNALAFVACSLAFGCRLAVPPEVAENADVLLVEDRSFWAGAPWASEEFSLGGQQVSEVERHGFGLGVSVGGVSTDSASGGYSFRFAARGGELVGRCDTSESGFGAVLASTAHTQVSVDTQQANLVCKCGAAELRLADSVFEGYSGALQLEDRRYEISTTYEAIFPAGYTISAKTPLAVLDNMNPGQRVWISRDWETEHRDELGCLFASLFLYRPPQD